MAKQTAKEYKAHGIPASWSSFELRKKLSDAYNDIRSLKNLLTVAEAESKVDPAEARRLVAQLEKQFEDSRNSWVTERGLLQERIRDLEAARLKQINDTPVNQQIDDLKFVLSERNEQLARLTQPVPMLLTCPMPSCGARHIDEGAFATKFHHTHSCQKCGHTWRPAVVATVGVQFLPGFKDPS